MAANQVKDKYCLRSIHQEIDLYDRKLAHLLKYQNFASEKERSVAADKLNAKRNLLVRDARSLVDAGIEYKVSEIPRSLRTAEQLAEEPSLKLAEQAVPPAPKREKPVEAPPQSGFSQLRKEIEEYVNKRRRTQTHRPAALTHV